MKRNTLILIAVLGSSMLVGCMEKDVYTGETRPKEYNSFDYSTVRQGVKLDVAYQYTGMKAKVYFELYDVKPVTETEYSYVKRDDVTPIYSAYTDENGRLQTTLNLPAYVEMVYAYAPAFYARTLIEAKVEDGLISIRDTEVAASTRVVTPTDKDYYCYMDEASPSIPNEYKDGPWKVWLGDYDKRRNGEVLYKCTNSSLLIDDWNSLCVAHAQVINSAIKCPEQYRSYTDMYINEDAEVAVTSLGQNTCWNCSLGYYYYPDGNQPTRLQDANVILLFPNTQDGGWEKSVVGDSGYDALARAGIDRGTCVQLMYYPNIASGSRAGATTVFPAGYRIGFVLANNAWSHRLNRFNANKRYRSATSAGLSVNNSGVAYGSPRTAAYRYGQSVMISFEDHTDDQNFSDAVITMKSNPVQAISDVPEVDTGSKLMATKELRGIYAFEDLWPNKGDYDLNDVVVRYDHEKLYNQSGEFTGESFVFKTFQNYAGNVNGLAFSLSPIASGTTSCFIRKAGAEQFEPATFEYEPADRVYRLTENVKVDMGAEYKVTILFDSPVSVGESSVKPFIFRAQEGDKRWEVHLPNEAPTSRMDYSLFGQQDDASRPGEGLYYVRAGNYPFAYFLAGADENDLNKILDISNESKSIDTLYGGYTEWVLSNGQSNTDWYKR
ncbi:MAG: LruC domain-containing protein [Bacteroides sp.]